MGGGFLGLGGLYGRGGVPEAGDGQEDLAHHHLPDRQDQAVALVEDGQEALAVAAAAGSAALVVVAAELAVVAVAADN